ncbi:MAG: FAD-dependent monooxygenase [Gemmatimonadaceae bacterium]|nr:FAD-dependent monooxygenase [Gemmatimonadaceae bacterium]
MAAPIVVVGGGPAGSAAAWGLARAGREVILCDRAAFPRAKPCAEYLSPQAARSLAEMGVLETVERAGAARLHGMRITAPNGIAFSGAFAAAHGFRGFRDHGLALPRERLDAILLDAARAAGVTVRERTMVTALTRDTTGAVVGVETRADDGTTTRLDASLVIGADGLRSVVARRAGLAAHRRWPRRIAFVAHYEGVDAISDVGEMHVTARGYLGLADVGGGRTNVALVVPAALAGEAAGDAAGFLDRWIAAHAALAPRFRGAQRVTPVQTTGPFASHARCAWAPGVALVGDAADFFDPFTGEGIYAALRGAELLVPYAFAATADTAREAAEALAAYDRCRRDAFAGKWRVERLVGTAVAFPALMNGAARLLARRRAYADLLIGVTGDFVPAGALLRPRALRSLLTSAP